MEMNYFCKACNRYCIEGGIEFGISRWVEATMCFICFDKQGTNNEINGVVIYGFWNGDKVIGRMILNRLLNQQPKLLPPSTIDLFQEFLMKMARRPRKHTCRIYNGSIIFPDAYLSRKDTLLLDEDGWFFN